MQNVWPKLSIAQRNKTSKFDYIHLCSSLIASGPIGIAVVLRSKARGCVDLPIDSADNICVRQLPQSPNMLPVPSRWQYTHLGLRHEDGIQNSKLYH